MGGFFGPTGGGGIKPTANSPYQRLAPFPDAAKKRNYGAGVIGSSIVIAGGTDNSTYYSTNTVTAFDTATNTITALAAMPLAVDSGGSAVVNGQLMIVGGESYTGSVTELNTLYIYNPSTNTWQAGPPTPAGYIWSPGCAAIPGDGAQVLLTAGGYQYSSSTGGAIGYTATTCIYHPSTNTWQQVANLPSADYLMPSFVVNGMAHFISYVQLWSLEYVYDTTTGTWSSKTITGFPAATPPAVTLFNGTVYALGNDRVSNIPKMFAYDYSTGTAVGLTPFGPALPNIVCQMNGVLYVTGTDGYVWTYDPSKDTGSFWTHLADVAINVYNDDTLMGSATIQDKLYLLSVNSNTYTTTVYSYDSSTGSWTQGLNQLTMPLSSYACSLGTRIFATVVTPTAVDLFSYETSTGTWTDLGPTPGLIQYQMLGGVSGIVVHAGGFNVQTSSATAAVYAYDPVAGTWSSRSPMPFSVYEAAVAVSGSQMLSIGGQTTTGYVPLLVYDAQMDSWSEKTHLDSLGIQGQTMTTVGVDAVDGYMLAAVTSVLAIYLYDISKDSWTVQAALPIFGSSQSAIGVQSNGQAIMALVPGVSDYGSTFAYMAFEKLPGLSVLWIGRDFR